MVARSLGHEVRGQHGYLSVFSYKSSWNTFFPCKKYSWNTEHIWLDWEIHVRTTFNIFIQEKKWFRESQAKYIFNFIFSNTTYVRCQHSWTHSEGSPEYFPGNEGNRLPAFLRFLPPEPWLQISCCRNIQDLFVIFILGL